MNRISDQDVAITNFSTKRTIRKRNKTSCVVMFQFTICGRYKLMKCFIMHIVLLIILLVSFSMDTDIYDTASHRTEWYCNYWTIQPPSMEQNSRRNYDSEIYFQRHNYIVLLKII